MINYSFSQATCSDPADSWSECGEGHWSLVTGHWSLVTGHWLPTPEAFDTFKDLINSCFEKHLTFHIYNLYIFVGMKFRNRTLSYFYTCIFQGDVLDQVFQIGIASSIVGVVAPLFLKRMAY